MNPFPEYPHVGPGNQIGTKGDNKLDDIARQHDLRYLKAESSEEIRAADKEFLNELFYHKPENIYDAIVHKISAGGIGLKYLVEGLFGVIYPRLPTQILKDKFYDTVFQQISTVSNYYLRYKYYKRINRWTENYNGEIFDD